MFKNSLILTFRNIIRNKVYFTINVLGLAVGMACCFLLLIFLMDEISYDKFHKRSNRIYRVIGETEYKGNILKETLTQEVLTPNLRLSFPAFEQVTRLQKSREKLIRYQEKTFYEARFFHADDNFFEIFSFKFLQGDPQTALVEPNSVVITESIKMKYFGSINPIGKIINLRIERIIRLLLSLKTFHTIRISTLISWVDTKRIRLDRNGICTLYTPMYCYKRISMLTM